MLTISTVFQYSFPQSIHRIFCSVTVWNIRLPFAFFVFECSCILNKTKEIVQRK